MLMVSVSITYDIGHAFGRTDAQSFRYGMACAFADCLKALAFPVSVLAYRAGRHLMGVVGLVVFALLTALSFSSTVGFGLASRTYAGDVQVLQAEQNRSAVIALRDDQQELARIRARLREPDLTARERRDLERHNQDLAGTIAERQRQLALAPRIITATTQSDALAHILGLAPETVTFGLSVLLALSLDIGPAIGFALAGALPNHSEPSRSKSKVRPRKPPALPPRSNAPTRPFDTIPNRAVRVDHSNIDRSVSNFLRGQTVGRGAIDATELFGTYQAYRHTLGLAPVSQRSFGDAMRRLGYAKNRRTASGRVQYINLSLVENLRTAA
ncbi:MAG: hypothetical protein AB7G35_05050 [Hyphomicrobiaceae bacterium]